MKDGRVRVRWTDQARRELLEIFEYISEESPKNAREAVSRIRKTLDVAREHPFPGRVVPELEVTNIRERVTPPWRVIYQVRRNEVIVLTVVRDRREIADTVRSRTIPDENR
jgi:addiction module RelE/StbE family toxin